MDLFSTQASFRQSLPTEVHKAFKAQLVGDNAGEF